MLKSYSNDFVNVQFVYNAEDPFSSDVEIYLLDRGMRLRINAKSQNLSHIDIFNSNSLEIRYENGILCSPSSPANFASVYNLLGPTHPGTMNLEFGTYELDYPGVTFSFPIPEEYCDLYTVTDPPQMPIELPDGTTPTAKQITIHRTNLGKYHLQSEGEITDSEGNDDPYVAVLADKSGLHFTTSQREILFGSRPEDAILAMGEPSEIFRKEYSVSIHKMAKEALKSRDYSDSKQVDEKEGEEAEKNVTDLEDYVLNYFDKGIDLVYDPRTHLLKSYALHTNLPGHYMFPNRYARCGFRLNVYDKFAVTYSTKFSDVKANFKNTPQPLVLNLAKTSDSRFSCFLHAYEQIFLEVTRQGFISRVTVYSGI